MSAVIPAEGSACMKVLKGKKCSLWKTCVKKGETHGAQEARGEACKQKQKQKPRKVLGHLDGTVG